MMTIGFTGDIAFSNYFSKGYETPNLMDGAIREFLQSTDHVVANIEAPVTTGNVQSDRKINHVNPPEAVNMLLSLNADIWNLANNHIMDCQEQGLQDTLNTAKEQGIRTIGAGCCKNEASEILELSDAGGIGIFGITYYRDFLKAGAQKPGCITCDDIETIKANIRAIKKRNRWCIMVIHSGEEFSHMPLPFVRRQYLRYLNMGADIIVGHHPHVVQNWERVGDKMIFYSLGNFVFDTDYQRKQEYSEFGVLVKFHFTKDSFTWKCQGTCVDRKHNRITACDPPAIFTEIDSKAYRKLWPLGVVNFVRTDHAAGIWLYPQKAEYSVLRWLWNDIEFFGFAHTVEILWGRMLSRLGTWKTCDPRLIQYLQ